MTSVQVVLDDGLAGSIPISMSQVDKGLLLSEEGLNLCIFSQRLG